MQLLCIHFLPVGVGLLIPAPRGLRHTKTKRNTQQSQRRTKNGLDLHMRYQIRFRGPIEAPTGVFPPNNSAGLSARLCVTPQVREAILLSLGSSKHTGCMKMPYIW